MFNPVQDLFDKCHHKNDSVLADLARKAYFVVAAYEEAEAKMHTDDDEMLIGGDMNQRGSAAYTNNQLHDLAKSFRDRLVQLGEKP